MYTIVCTDRLSSTSLRPALRPSDYRTTSKIQNKKFLLRMHLFDVYPERLQPGLGSHFWKKILPPTILLAGLPRIMASLANCCPQLGHSNFPPVSSSTMRSLKHLTRFPVPPYMQSPRLVAPYLYLPDCLGWFLCIREMGRR